MCLNEFDVIKNLSMKPVDPFPMENVICYTQMRTPGFCY